MMGCLQVTLEPMQADLNYQYRIVAIVGAVMINVKKRNLETISRFSHINSQQKTKPNAKTKNYKKLHSKRNN